MLKLLISIITILSLNACSKKNLQENQENIFEPYRFKTLILSNGLKINYNIQGKENGTNIVLVHGGGDSQSLYIDWVKALKDQYRILTFDLPGHGLSGQLSNVKEYGAPKFAETIGNIVDALKIDKFILAGHSFGGDATARYALANPNKVKGLILIGAGGFITPDELKAREQIKNLTDKQAIEAVFGPQFANAKVRRQDIITSLKGFVHNPNNIREEAIERFYIMTQYTPNKEVYNQMQINYFRKHKDLVGLNTLEIPTLLLWGAQDPLVPVQIAKQKFHKQLKNSELVTLEGIGHLPTDEAPKECLEALVKFLKKNNLN